MSSKKSVSLVLGSGGARGNGAYRWWLESAGGARIPLIDGELPGAPVGALVAGYSQRGNLPQFKDWICDLGRVDVFGLMFFSFSAKGIYQRGKGPFWSSKNHRRIVALRIWNPFRCKCSRFISKERANFWREVYSLLFEPHQYSYFGAASGYRFG